MAGLASNPLPAKCRAERCGPKVTRMGNLGKGLVLQMAIQLHGHTRTWRVGRLSDAADLASTQCMGRCHEQANQMRAYELGCLSSHTVLGPVPLCTDPTTRAEPPPPRVCGPQHDNALCG